MRNAASAADYIRNRAADQTTGYSSAAALTFLAWDVCISFSLEVRLIWGRPNGYLRWLYAFIRYLPLFAEMVFFVYFVFPGPTTISAGKLCRANTVASAIVLECTIVAVELVLLVRVHALYNRSRVVLVALLAGFAASFCATFFGMYSAADHLQFDEQCLISSAPRIMILVWLSPVAFDAFMFALTMLKFRQSRREGLRRPILNTMVRDGTWAFILTLVVMVLNAVIYTVFSETLSGIFYFWATSVLSFIGSHVLLNLRQIALEPRLSWDYGSDSTTICLDDIDFTASDETVVS
ncbi:hypothetical protein VTO73DRAFT_3708 [Trametes versicolor]